MLAGSDAQDVHSFVVSQAREEFRRDQEVLRCVLAAGDLHHTLVHHALIARVHTLIDFVDDAERSLGHRLQGHQIENRRNGALAARLSMLV